MKLTPSPRIIMAGLGIAASVAAYFAMPFEGEGLTTLKETTVITAEKKVENKVEKIYRAYKCPAGYWTIGRGHMLGKDEKYRNMTATQSQVDEWYRQDVAIAEAAFYRLVNRSHPVNVQASAIDFIFNVGATKFASSTLRLKLNAQQFNRASACGEYLRWMGAGGKDCSKPEMKCGGIPKRRNDERELCLSDKIFVVDFGNGVFNSPDGH